MIIHLAVRVRFLLCFISSQANKGFALNNLLWELQMLARNTAEDT